MQFNEQTANYISAKYSLAPSTIKTWRHRKEIPDYYQTDQQLWSKNHGSKQVNDDQAQIILSALRSGKLCLPSVYLLAGITGADVNLALQARGTVRPANLTALKKALIKIRNQVSIVLNFIDRRPYPYDGVDKFLELYDNSKEIYFPAMLGNDKALLSRIADYQNRRITKIAITDIEQIAKSFKTFRNDTTI